MMYDEFKKKHITYIWISIDEYQKHKKEYDNLAQVYGFKRYKENDKIWFRK